MEAGAVRAAAPGALRAASPAFLRLASDNHLVRLVRTGRQSAFEVLYDRYHRPILAFCAHLLGDRDEAEDAVQHTFMSAYNSLLEHDRPIQLRPWLFAIARNRCYSLLRARREVAVPDMLEAQGENPASVVARREELRDLVLDVSALPDDQRAALVMAELGALSHDEIALALEVPRDKVKALVFQARESLAATRAARETDCAVIREELSSLRGRALRRSHLRRHLHSCAGCREYRSQLRHQRARLAALLPVVPSAALKGAVLNATVGARSTATGAGGGAAAAAGSSALKLALVKPVAMAVLGAAGAVMVAHAVSHGHHRSAPVASRAPVFVSFAQRQHAPPRALRVPGAGRRVVAHTVSRALPRREVRFVVVESYHLPVAPTYRPVPRRQHRVVRIAPAAPPASAPLPTAPATVAAVPVQIAIPSEPHPRAAGDKPSDAPPADPGKPPADPGKSPGDPTPSGGGNDSGGGTDSGGCTPTGDGTDSTPAPSDRNRRHGRRHPDAPTPASCSSGAAAPAGSTATPTSPTSTPPTSTLSAGSRRCPATSTTGSSSAAGSSATASPAASSPTPPRRRPELPPALRHRPRL